MKVIVKTLILAALLSGIGCSEKAEALVDVLFNKMQTTMTPGTTYRFEITFYPQDASNRELTWFSGNESVATVSDDGEVTAIREGFADIYVRNEKNAIEKTLQVQVIPEFTGIPVVAGMDWSWSELPPAEFYTAMREAGITHQFAYNVPTARIAEKNMDNAWAYGIETIADTKELKSDLTQTVKRLMNHQGLDGYLIQDEPKAPDFPYLNELVQQVKAIDDKHFCLINLNPIYQQPHLGTSTYREYVHRSIVEAPTEFVSFDNYPIWYSDGIRSVMEDWYENIEIIADEAHRAGKVFWAYTLTASHYSYPVPTLNDMRLQVFSYLIYGAQGLMYFMWSTGNTIDFRSVPVTPSGEKTESYPVMVQINNEIKGLTPVFQDADFLWVRHTGDPRIPQGTTRLDNSELPPVIKSLHIATPGFGAAVSLLENKGFGYLVVLNRNINNSITVQAEVAANVKTVAKDGVSTTIGTGVKNYTLAPGDLYIYQWKK
ncbi:MAG: Ig-like domain-containing protein [Dysgonamonadaceae bacterium]|jgi:hypothetical protein|nr:Ig-like domain-containing protein [Dysgonamonadaceae bacterium]